MGEYTWLLFPGVFFVGFPLLVLLIRKLGFSLTKQLEALQKIVETGEPAQARVVALRDTGGTVNRKPLVELVVEVQKGQAPYQATLQAVVSITAVPRVQPGCVVAVFVDRADPSRVALGPDV